MIKVLYEAGHRPDKMGLLIDLSWIFLNGDMGPSNSLLFSTQSSCRAPIVVKDDRPVQVSRPGSVVYY